MDINGISYCSNLESFSTLSLGSELSYDPEVEFLSSQKVFLDQDLLTLILLRVPVRKLICFASVSKLWRSLITAPRFSLLRSNGNLPLCTSGLFFQINVCKAGVPNGISFVPLDNDNHTSSPFRDLPYDLAPDSRASRIRIVHSCAGLLLCSSCPYAVFQPWFRYYIYNPTTNQLRTLPNNDTLDHSFAAVLALEMTHRDVGNNINYFNLDEERLETMPRPPIGLRSSRPVTFYVGVSQNHLHVVEVYARDNILNVYEMENDYSGWFLKYEVDLSPISQVFPEMVMTPDQVYILSLVRREHFEEDSFLVLHIPGKPRKAIHYNLVDKCFKGIWDFTYPKYLTTQWSWVRSSRQPWFPFHPPRKFQSFEFIASLSCV